MHCGLYAFFSAYIMLMLTAYIYKQAEEKIEVREIGLPHYFKSLFMSLLYVLWFIVIIVRYGESLPFPFILIAMSEKKNRFN